MSLFIIDRRNWNVVARADSKRDLPKEAKGMLVDTDNLDRLKAAEALMLYQHMVSGQAVPPWVTEQIKDTLEHAKLGAPLLATADTAKKTPVPPPPKAKAQQSGERVMTVKARGIDYSDYINAGWTDALLIEEGLMEDPNKKADQGGNGEGPVATVRQLCERMKGKPRKEIVQAAVNAGINPNTARTQVQRWFSENK